MKTVIIALATLVSFSSFAKCVDVNGTLLCGNVQNLADGSGITVDGFDPAVSANSSKTITLGESKRVARELCNLFKTNETGALSLLISKKPTEALIVRGKQKGLTFYSEAQWFKHPMHVVSQKIISSVTCYNLVEE